MKQREIFLSRRESFPMQADINMNNNFIQNIATPTSSHQGVNKGYCDYNFLNRQKGVRITGSLSMNQNDLFEIPAPKYGSSAANKNYVDNQMGTKADLSKTTTQTFQGRVQVPDFNSGGHNGSDIVNLRYIDGIFLNKKTGGTLNNPITFLSSLPSNQRQIHNIGSPQFNSRTDGSVPMAADLDMNGNKIKNVGTPYTYENDAAVNVGFFNTELNASNSNVYTQITNNYKQYVNEELLKSHLVSSHIENAFKYLSDQDESSSERNIIVNGIQDFNGSPHKNKKAYDIDLIYTSGTQNYDSKIGINLYPLPAGKFTIIMEYYFPEDINISLLAEASTAIINKQAITNFPSYKKQLVQINQQTKDTPDYLFFTIIGSGTTATNPEGYLVFYGVKEWVDIVPSEIYDHALETGMFKYNNGDMKMYNDIDMNNHRIKNFHPPTNPTDLLMKQSLIIHEVVTNGLLQTRHHIFFVEGSRLTLNNPYINYIILNVDKIFFNTQDKIIVDFDRNHGGIGAPRYTHYQFPFHTSSTGFVKIIINRSFIGYTNTITTEKIDKASFLLSYLPVTFKTS